MFSHPVSIAGYILIGLGVAMAYMASGSPYESSIPIAMGGGAAEKLGAFLVLLGVIAQGFGRIEKYLAGNAQMKAAFEASQQTQVLPGPYAPTQKAPSTEEELQRKLMERGLKP